jgi:hypothetical protein
MDEESIIPAPRSFPEEDIRYCQDTGDYKPILFEWYRFVASLGFVVTNIRRNSPSFRPIPAQHYHVLMGLLNRCTRLMLSNMALSHEGKFGETTAIVDRCIFESALKIIWLCKSTSQEEFTRYIADGLKTELEFKTLIKANIAANGGVPLPIEKRMLTSIGNHIAASGLTEEEVSSAKKFRDIAAIIKELGFERVFYVVGQRIGSHHVHGTWSSLLFNYLDEQEGEEQFCFKPRDHDCSTHINQFMFTPMVVLHAMSEYVQYALDDAEAEAFQGVFESTKEEIIKMYSEAGENAS